MADKKINITFDASMDVSKLKSSVAEINKSLQGVVLPTTLGNNFKTTLSSLEREIANFEKRSAEGLRSATDFSQLKKSGDSIISLYEKLIKYSTELGNLNEKQLINLMPKATVDNIKKASAAMETFKATVDKTTKSINSQIQKVENQRKVIDQLNNDLAAAKGQKTVSGEEYKQMQADIAAAAKEVQDYEQKQAQLNIDLAEMEQRLKAPTKSSKYRDLKKEIDACGVSLEQAKIKQEQLQDVFNKTTTVTANARDIRRITQDIDDETVKLQGLEAELTKLQSQDNNTAITQLKTDLQGIQGLDLTQCGNDVQQIENAVNNFQSDQIKQVKDNLIPIINATQIGSGSVKNFAQQFNRLSNDFGTFIDRSREFDMLQSRIQHFFGITNSIMLFRRAINSAVDTIKELDKAMTEMAVVTDLGVGDYWNQLPTYTKRANELGLAIKDVYESMTLFYQQGLNTAQATALSNATLKMARIAGLDAAEATDRMTNALRGFHMELNEDSATNVADVYSALAARTASDVDEISVAMTKVASIADSAGMSFENTAAFLSQIIETTRESAETAGTALKTVIARFSEVKKLRSEGLSTGTDEEGESIDVNKVDAALKTVGISMKDFFEGAEGLDSIFIQLTNKWDTLDTYTQRYIATQAAGSRQQSRFIALMSDAARQQELVALANNAAGASAEQYAKTLESLETKLNKLKNAWDQFTMGIANEEIVKFGVDALTELVNIINNCTEALGDFWGALAKLGLGFGALKAGKVLFSALFAALKNQAAETGISSGVMFGKTFASGMQMSFGNITKMFKKGFWFGGKPDFKPFENAVTNLETSFANLTTAETTAEAALATYDAEMATQGVVTQATYDAKIAAESELAAARGTHVAILQTLGISEQEYVAVQSLGLSQDEMAIALSDKETVVKLAQIATTEGLTEAERKEQIENVLNNRTRAQGLIIKAADIIATKITILGKLKEYMASKLVAAGLKAETAAMLASLGIVGIFIIAVAALVAIFIALAKAIRNANPKKQFKDAVQASKDAEEAANNANDAYSNLIDTLSSINEAEDSLDTLTEGTQEWKDAVYELNQQILELLDKYPKLAKYVTNNNGKLELNTEGKEVQAVVNSYKDVALNAQQAATQEKINQVAEQNTLEYTNLTTAAKAYKWVTKTITVPNNPLLTKTVKEKSYLRGDTETLAKALVNGDVAKYASDENDTLEKQLAAYAKDNNILIDVTDNTIEALQEFGNSLTESADLTNTYYDIMASSSANKGAEGRSAITQTRINTYATGEQAERFVNNARASVEATNDKTLADRYANEVLGLSVGEYEVGRKGKVIYTDESGEHTVKGTDIDTQMAAIEGMKDFEKTLDTFDTTIGRATDKFTQHLYEAAEGAKLTAKDLETFDIDFTSLDLTTFTDKDKNDEYINANAQAIKDYYSTLFSKEDIEKLYGGWDEFIKYVAESGQIAATTFADIKANLKDWKLDENLFDDYELSAEALQSLSTALNAAFEANGAEGAAAMSQYLLNLLKNIDDPKMQEQFNAIINSIDWADQDSIIKNIDLLEELGFVLEDDLTDSLIKCTNAAKQLNFDNFREEFSNLQEIVDSVFEGNNISAESFDKLSDSYKQFFTQMADGTYGLTISAQEFANIVKATQFNDVKAKLSSDYLTYTQNQATHTAAGDLTSQDITNLRQSPLLTENVIDMTLYQKQLDLITAMGIKSQEEVNKITNDIFNNEDVDARKQAVADFTQMANEAATAYEALNYEIENNEQQLLEDQALLLSTATTLDEFDYTVQQIIDTMGEGSITENTYSNALIQLASQYSNCAEKILVYRNAITSGNTELITASEDLLRASITIGEAAQRYDLDASELQSYADTLYKSMDTSAQSAAQLAIANTRLDAGVLSLNEHLEDYTKQLDSNDKMSSEWSKTMNTVKKDLANVLNMDISSIGNDFAYDALKSKDLKKALDGDTEAILRLRAAAADQLILDISLNTPDPESITTLWEEIKTAIQDSSFEAPTFNQSKLIESFNTLIDNANMTREDVEAALAGLNVSADLDVQYNEVEHEIPVTSTYTTVAKLDQGDPANGVPPAWKRTQWTVNEKPIKTKEFIPQYTIKGTKNEGGVTKGISKLPAPTVSYSNTTSGIVDQQGGGGSESEPEYTNPYDKMYNTLEDINEELKERERLEKRYQILCKRGEKTQAKTKDYYDDLNKSWEKEYKLQQSIASGREKEIKSTVSKYSDLADYVKFDSSTMTIDINWDKIQGLDEANNEEVGERVDEFIDKLEELRDSYDEAIDAQYDIIDTIEDTKQELVDAYFDLEDRTVQALRQIDEDLVDEQEKLYDAIDEANSDLTTAMRDNINATRQLRDNNKSEEEIAKKERRLAYLRQDTSGANKIEIMQLEDELDDMKLSYQDTIVDQALENIEAQNDKAAEQRARQIELARAQIEWNEKNGVYAAQFQELLKGAMNEDGTFDTSSSLYKVLYNGENWNQYSEEKQTQMMKDANSDVIDALAALNNNLLDTDVTNDGIGGNLNDIKTEDIGTPETPKSNPTPKTDTTPKVTKQTVTDDIKKGVAAAIVNGANNHGGWGNGTDRKNKLNEKFENGWNIIQGFIDSDYKNGYKSVNAFAKSHNLSNYYYGKFKNGGLADFTGPAWLDGSKAKPEIVLDARDTQNFIQLKDILSDILRGGITNNQNNGDYAFDIDINVDELGSDYDVSRLAAQVKQELVDAMTYRNNNAVNFLR